MRNWLPALVVALILAFSASSGPAIVANASTKPQTLDSVYVNNTITPFTYGGWGQIPVAHTFSAIHYYVRTAGAVGTTNNTFRITDGSNNCDFSFACNQTAGAKRQATTAGTCTFSAGVNLTYSFTSTGDCNATTDIEGNIALEGI